MRDVFLTFLRLGTTSFGGPVAHLGYFRREFVERQSWIDEQRFAQIVALCSILPGPTSSQVGMMVGLQRAGPVGALAAWLGFTLPSAIALTVAASVVGLLEGVGSITTSLWFSDLLAGLTAAATGIVAQAVLAMAKTQCPDRATRTIAAGAGILALIIARSAILQWVPIAAGALAGIVFLSRTAAPTPVPVPVPVPVPTGSRTQHFAARNRRGAIAAALLFLASALTSIAVPARSGVPAFIATIVRAGSLVFGGGHIVLPLLASLVPLGLMRITDFYAGYGLAQAVPGPLFTFAAFLGFANRSPLHGAAGAAIATGLIFLPSFLLVFGVSPLLNGLRPTGITAAALRGANAAVVGLLAALLYSPLITGLGSSPWRMALAVTVFTIVTFWNMAPWIAVVVAALGGALWGSAGVAI